MIVCLEGASAVGKTSTSRVMADRLGAAVVPEVNALFERPSPEPEDWYLERQAQRWTMARKTLSTHPLAVLDGDPFQPLWYNWSFGFQGLQSVDTLGAFYRPLIADGSLGFPDVYVHLVTDQNQLRRRKEDDTTRVRRNFDRHLRLVETQRRYFAAMAALAPSLVWTVETDSLDASVSRIKMILERRREEPTDSLSLFDGLLEWLGCHQGESRQPSKCHDLGLDSGPRERLYFP